MRILFISEFYPFDVRTEVFGVFKRMRMFLDALDALGELDVLFFAPLGVDPSPAAARRLAREIEAVWGLRLNVFIRAQQPAGPQPLRGRLPLWVRCVTRGAVTYDSELSLNNSHAPSLEAVAKCLDRGPDMILAFRLGTMAPLLRLGRKLPPIFFDLDDVEHIKAMRIARSMQNLLPRLATYAAVPILWWSEYRAMALARSTFVSSVRDLQRFTRFPRGEHRVVVPNAVAMPHSEPPPSEMTLLFLGSYIYGPNIEAAEYLIRHIWPRVKEREPAARLLIGGPWPDRIPSHASSPSGVEFLGFVDDLEALYRRTRLVCCPVQVGAGTRIKILEAAAHGKPIVSTSVGAEGIQFRDGEEILLRDDPDSFATACLQLLADSALGERLGSAAREVVCQRYERDLIIGDIRRAITLGLATP